MGYHTVMGCMTGCVDKRNAYRPVPGDEVSFTTCSACLARTRFPDSRPKFPDLVVINIVQICRRLVIPAGNSPALTRPERRRSSPGAGHGAGPGMPTVRTDGCQPDSFPKHRGANRPQEPNP